MLNIFLIIWRESLEAALIIGILYTFFKKGQVGARSFRHLKGGIGIGIALSLMLGFVTLLIQDQVIGSSLDYFQAGMMIFSSLLMTQMVIWMMRMGSALKSTLEKNLHTAHQSAHYWGITFISAFAIAREGAEIVIYLYSMSIERPGAMTGFYLSAIAGFCVALLTAWSFSMGIRFLNVGVFFKATSFLLLFSAAGLMVTGFQKLIEVENWELSTIFLKPLWDSSWLLDTHSILGSVFTSFTGYRPSPNLLNLFIYLGYWALALGWIWLIKPHEMKREFIEAKLANDAVFKYD